MVNISDNNIRNRPGALKPSSARVGVKIAPPPDADERKSLEPPRQRGFSSIPNPEVLEKLIAQAVSALRRGIYWDRGSILNLVV